MNKFRNNWRANVRILSSVSAPHPAHAGPHVDAWLLAPGPIRRTGHRERPSRFLEQSEQTIGNEAGSRRINVPVAPRLLAVGKKALRYDQMQIILGTRHGDVK